jgi:hypothetical protein
MEISLPLIIRLFSVCDTLIFTKFRKGPIIVWISLKRITTKRKNCEICRRLPSASSQGSVLRFTTFRSE